MSRRRPRQPAFTLIELLVVVAILSLLLAILAPSLRRARQTAVATTCAGHLWQVGQGFRQYISAFDRRYPYGVPRSAETMNHPHHETWRDGGRRGGGRPPQQQFWDLHYLRDPDTWICPADPSPQNYIWWDYDVHPDFDRGASYMMSEQALFGVTWWTHHIFRDSQMVQPATFGLATDGLMCPNGWTWATVDPNWNWPDPNMVRTDWSHGDRVNVLYGDGHAEPREQDGISLRLRTNPLRIDPLRRSH